MRVAYANSERINCVRNLCDLRRIFVGSLSERRSHKLRMQFMRSELACANSDSPSESSLANSGAIRSDGRKNPSAYYALASLTGKRPRPPYGGRADLKLEDFPPADIRGGKIRLCFGQKVR